MNGHDEDPYGDDGFDDLPAEDLIALEKRAVQASQRVNASLQNESQAKPQEVFSTEPTQPATLVQWEREQWRSQRVQYRESPQIREGPEHEKRLSSPDYGNFDEDDDFEGEVVDTINNTLYGRQAGPAIPARGLGEATQREQWRTNRYGAGTARGGLHNPPQDQSHPQWGHNGRQANNMPEYRGINTPGERSQPNKTAVTIVTKSGANDNQSDGLQVRLEHLMKERDMLQKSLHEVKTVLQTKAGENLILRTKQEKATKEHERRLITLQKHHEDEAAKLKAQAEKAAEERETVTIRNRFLEREVLEEGQKVKSLRQAASKEAPGPGKTRENKQDSPATTPKRDLRQKFSDGFDDDEVIMLSPSKVLGSRPKSRTPRVGSKRKRKDINDSPIKPLQLSSRHRQDSSAGKQVQEGVVTDEAILYRLQPHDDRFEFFQSILNYRPGLEKPRVLESFAKFSFPSEPKISLSSAFYDALPPPTANKVDTFPSIVCGIFISLWTRSLNEKYYLPITALVEILTFILISNTSTVVVDIMEDVLPVAQETIGLVAIPRFEKALDAGVVGPQRSQGQLTVAPKDPPKSIPDVDVPCCMDLIHLIALASHQHEPCIKRFWQLLKWDLCLMMLSWAQRIREVIQMLDILATGIRKDTIGPITSANPDEQSESEKHLVDRITVLLNASKQLWMSQYELEEKEIANMKLNVLRLLVEICCTDHGCKAMAFHPWAIGRLVRFAHDELNALYDFNDRHDQSAEQVSLAIRLLHCVISKNPIQDKIDMHEKLGVIQGGEHKYLVCLTRLVYSEGLVLEAGIQDEVVDYARQLLENRITPEEGDALEQAMEMTRPR